jgi:hypothetical protein
MTPFSQKWEAKWGTAADEIPEEEQPGFAAPNGRPAPRARVRPCVAGRRGGLPARAVAHDARALASAARPSPRAHRSRP